MHSIFYITRFISSGIVLGAFLFPLVLFAQEATTTEAETVPYASEILADPGRIIGDFVVGPGKVETTLAPGETETVLMSVTNRIGEAKTFEIQFEDIAAGDESQAVVLLGSDTGPYTLKDYLAVPRATFTLEHMERAVIPVTISAPADAPPGGRYGSVLVSVTSKEAEVDENGTEVSSAVISRIGTLFFVTTPGDVRMEGELQKFATAKDRWFYFDPEIAYGITYENAGSVHLNPYGYISVTNMFGSEVKRTVVEPWFVLPQSVRTREINTQHPFMFGRYTATVTLNRGYEDIVDTKSVVFWVIPWKLLLAVFTFMFVTILIVRWFITRFSISRK